MKHPETDYCAGCEAEVNQYRKMVKNLLGKLGVTENTIDPNTLDLTSTKTLTMTTSPKGLTASIRMPMTRGDSMELDY